MELLDFMKKNIHFIIVITYVFIMYKYVNEKDTYVMIGLTIIAGFLLLQSRKIVEGQQPAASQTPTTSNTQSGTTITSNAAGTVQIKLSGSSANDAKATVQVDANGSLMNIKVTTPGSKYCVGTKIKIHAGFDANQKQDVPSKEAKASVKVLANGQIDPQSIKLDDPGAGYVNRDKTGEKQVRVEFIRTGEQNCGSVIPGKQASDKTAGQKIKDVTSSDKYKLALTKKNELLKKLGGVKAANDKESPKVTHQDYLQKETHIKVQKGIPRIGAYDGLCLSGLTTKTNYHIVSNDKINSYMGVQFPPEEVSTEDDVLDGPSVDGDEDSPHKLSMFANNMTSINCCGNSPFVSSSGCICMTNKQKEFIRNRGLYSTKMIKDIESDDEVSDDEDIEPKIEITEQAPPSEDKMVLLNSDTANQNVRLSQVTADSVGGGQVVPGQPAGKRDPSGVVQPPADLTNRPLSGP